MKKILAILLSFAFGLVSFQSVNAAEPEIPTIPEVSFSYASLHAIDHTHIVIPVSKGWHKDVGITVTPEPYGSSVGADKIVAGLTSGSFDVMSGSTVFSLAGYDVNNNYRDFGHGDIFQGFGFMIDPNGSYKTIDQFIDGGIPLFNRFNNSNNRTFYRSIVTEGGPIQEDIALDAPYMDDDPIFSVGGDLAFNWGYSNNNGVWIVLTGAHTRSPSSSGRTVLGIILIRV